MKKNDAEILIRDFLIRTANIDQIQRILRDNTTKLVRELQVQDEELEKLNPEFKEEFGKSCNVFYFTNPYNGEAQAYESRKLTYREKADLLFIIQNKQYQWLLVEAYEHFEDYIVRLYLSVRENYPSLRIAKDSKADIKISELKKAVYLIIDKFRNSFDGYRKFEKNNELKKIFAYT